ncbi:MAG TPA: glycosyltransferase family 2 protein, partial [Dermatophilaceae bacterium]
EVDGGPRQPRVCLVVVNYGTSHLSAEAVSRAISLSGPALHRVQIVDNSAPAGATDGVLGQLARSDPRISCLAPGRNLGFAGGVNAAIEQAPGSDYYWLLNSDALVDERSLAELLAAVPAEGGVVGSQLVGADGVTQSRGGRRTVLFGLVSHQGAGSAPVRHEGPHPSAWVHGASVLISRDTWSQLGGFDERFFLYFEETDLCFRARKAGWPVLVAPRSVVRHSEAESFGPAGRLSRDTYLSRNYVLFAQRHLPRPVSIMALTAWVPATYLTRLARGQRPRAHAHLRGVRQALTHHYGPL